MVPSYALSLPSSPLTQQTPSGEIPATQREFFASGKVPLVKQFEGKPLALYGVIQFQKTKEPTSLSLKSNKHNKNRQNSTLSGLPKIDLGHTATTVMNSRLAAKTKVQPQQSRRLLTQES